MPTALPPPPSPPPGPDPSRPLTEREKRALADLDTALQASDPQLSQRLAAGPASSAPPGRFTVDRGLQAVAILTMVFVLVPAAWRGLLIVFALMVGLPLLLLLLDEPGRRPWTTRRRPPDDAQPPQDNA